MARKSIHQERDEAWARGYQQALLDVGGKMLDEVHAGCSTWGAYHAALEWIKSNLGGINAGIFARWVAERPAPTDVDA